MKIYVQKRGVRPNNNTDEIRVISNLRTSEKKSTIRLTSQNRFHHGRASKRK